MSFSAVLKVNSSPVEKIGKTLSEGLSFDVELKAGTSVLKPVLLLASPSDVTGYNYMYISQFGRYYFIDDIKSVRNGQWEISAHVDVLETYKDKILSNEAIIKRQQNKYNTYLNDPEWLCYAYENVIAYKFTGTSPFNKSLKFVLAVAGA